MAQINMNGRIHDPLIGRFMSADAYIQAPDDLQSHNRYAYVMNNPLNLTDPTGFFSWRQEWRNAKRKIVRVAALALDYYCGGCGTLLLVAWDGYWMKDAKGQKLGWKGAAFGAGMAYIGQQTGGNQWYTAGVNAITACGMGHMSGGSCKAGLHESLGNSAGTLLLGNNLAGAALGGLPRRSCYWQRLCSRGSRWGEKLCYQPLRKSNCWRYHWLE